MDSSAVRAVLVSFGLMIISSSSTTASAFRLVEVIAGIFGSGMYDEKNVFRRLVVIC